MEDNVSYHVVHLRKEALILSEHNSSVRPLVEPLLSGH